MMSYAKSKHFTVEQLADGVFAIIHHEGGWGIGNAGIIDLGDRALIYDTFLTPLAAADLREAAEELTGHPVKIVVNSHFHNDHIWGNQVFDPATLIVSSADTRELITTAGKKEYDWYKENSGSRLEEAQSQYDDEEDGDKRNDLGMSITYYEAIVESLPELSIKLPTLTFSNQLEISGADFSVQLLSFKGGHTGSDTVLYIPSQGILFMSDLLFVGCHPCLGDGDPANLKSILAEVAQLNASKLVPGHGPVGTAKDLQLMIDYVQHCEQLVGKMIRDGIAAEKIAQMEIPGPFKSWAFPEFFKANLRALYQQRMGGER